MIFQTETFLKENGDKLPADQKPAVEAALEKLKEAHKSADIAAIDAATAELNNVMQAASQQMYTQAGGAQAGPGAGFNGAQGGAQQPNNDNDVQDVDFEEVK